MSKTHISVQAMNYCCCDCNNEYTPGRSLENNQNIPYLVAIVDCTHLWLARASFLRVKYLL